MNARKHVIVEGRVQGVFFRNRTKHEADTLGVKGWILNRSDGQVEAIFEGEEAAVRKIIAFCKTEPPGAKVKSVAVTSGEHTGEFREFEIRY